MYVDFIGNTLEVGSRIVWPTSAGRSTQLAEGVVEKLWPQDPADITDKHDRLYGTGKWPPRTHASTKLPTPEKIAEFERWKLMPGKVRVTPTGRCSRWSNYVTENVVWNTPDGKYVLGANVSHYEAVAARPVTLTANSTSIVVIG
jgi:hypothetical protein